MATRISDETAARIDASWDKLIYTVTQGDPLEPVYALCSVSGDQVRVYRLTRPDREKEWQVAREQAADAYAERILEVINNPGADSGIARVKIDGLKWLASKRNPRVYSEKQTIDMNVKTVDLTKIIADANLRLAASRQGALIEGQATRIEDIVQHSIADLM